MQFVGVDFHSDGREVSQFEVRRVSTGSSSLEGAFSARGVSVEVVIGGKGRTLFGAA